MGTGPKRISSNAARASIHTASNLKPISYWKSDAMGIMAYVFEEPEATLRRSGLVPEWVGYPPDCAGAGIAVPAHHAFPSYLKLLRLRDGRVRLTIDIRAVLRADDAYQDLMRNLLADTQLSLIKGEPR
ncbi:hypothetical protein [Nitrosovibrio sp. Nv17]|jgi:hypothetical protein|uniref:hypothetical protein n=1 Tax=Nitrosovibrio sp. Nv17 TaxID=1855339 RepID=UPI000908D9A0|nr:hypothetical protein [Nitrosovibrio sp. Nv17]SFW13109.1 hypothetical protein SAMN05216414_10217 [Nitrosovibrio sp. Nv17]